MRQTGVAKGRCERRGDADEDQWEEDLASREDRRNLLALGCREDKIEKSRNSSKGGLNCVQDDREGKAFRGRLGLCCARRPNGVGDGCNSFL